MAKKTAKGLVEFAKSKLGTPYVYGMKGAKLTKAKFNELKKMYGSMVWDSDVNKVGKVCCDCSGLISWYTGVLRGSSNFKETATKVLPISDIDKAQVGCALWKNGHIGIYIGKVNGVHTYIAEDGSAYGCQQKAVSWQKWTHILWLKDIDYSAATPATTTKKVSYYKKYTGTSTSIVIALEMVGAKSSYSYRSKIAKANGIKDYTGTAAQNTKLLNLLKQGKLIKV